MTVFEDRAEAGRLLADAVRDAPALDGAERVVVLAIPRGGLPVAAAVAKALGAPIDVVVVRRLRSPHNAEVSFGTVGADGHAEVDEALIRSLGLSEEQVAEELADRRAAVTRRVDLYRGVRDPVDLAGAVVVVVDDGIDTGSTAREAISYVRRTGAAKVVLAAPVAPREVAEELEALADDVVVLSRPAEFLAVDQAYRHYDDLDDEAALASLAAAPIV
jgi:predicted phosphoribosyltransferase